MNRTKFAFGSLVGVFAALALASAAPSLDGAGAAQAQTTATAASPAAAKIAAGTYNVDPNHTQVLWSVDHMGFSRLYGMVGGMSGTLDLDPARLSQARVTVDIPLSGLTVTSPSFAQHLQTADLFDTANFPTARFVSRKVDVRGQEATITGDLTLRGVTKPVTLEARFYGAGANPMTKAETIGFSAKAQLKRSDFNLGYAVPAVSDMVDLEITTAFESAAG